MINYFLFQCCSGRFSIGRFDIWSKHWILSSICKMQKALFNLHVAVLIKVMQSKHCVFLADLCSRWIFHCLRTWQLLCCLSSPHSPGPRPSPSSGPLTLGPGTARLSTALSPWTQEDCPGPRRAQRIHWKPKSLGRQFLRRRTMGVLLHLAHPFILGHPQGTQLFGHCNMGQSFRRRIAFN